ncbi:MAG TPA: glycosyltransferase family 39 protein [Candidatus Dormibacteraeota bacterium]|nr:glycosyltransferase family 39 protein [Candidatus Dormibacteraeota bacterium]
MRTAWSVVPAPPRSPADSGAATRPEATPAGAAPDAPRRLARLRTPYALSIGAITAAGLGARLVALGHQSLWRDEAFTLLVSRRSWLDMYAAVRSDSAPPLSYALTHLAASASGTVAAVRLPAALAGTAVIPLGAAVGRRLGGAWAGICAALVCAVTPAAVLPARDARMYALAGALVLAMALTAWRAAERPGAGRLAAHGAVVAAALLTDYFAAFAAVAVLAGAALALRVEARTLARIAAATAAGGAVLLLWLPFATAQLHHAQQPFWVPPVGGDSTLGVLTQFLVGPAVDSDLPQRDTTILLQTLCLFGASLAGALVLFAVPWDPSRRRRAVAYVFIAGFGAAVLMFLVSLAHPILDARYVSVVWTPLFPLLGLGLSRLRWAAALPLAAMAAATWALCSWPTRADVETLVHENLDSRVGPADLVLVSPDTYLQVLVYADGATAARTHIEATSLPWYWGVAAFPPGALLPSVPAGAQRIDVVTQPGDDQPAIPSDHVATGTHCATRVCVTVYEPRASPP